jgi:alanine racemase
VTAPVVRRFAPGEAGWAGYGDTAIGPDVAVVVLRCGYGDGFPMNLADGADILTVGMQYTSRAVREGIDARVLIGGGDDVDALAARARITPHELVVGLASR